MGATHRIPLVWDRVLCVAECRLHKWGEPNSARVPRSQNRSFRLGPPSASSLNNSESVHLGSSPLLRMARYGVSVSRDARGIGSLAEDSIDSRGFQSIAH